MATFKTELSLSSLDAMIKRLENKKKDYPQVAIRIADRLADEMLTDVQSKTTKHNAKPYKDSVKKETRLEGNVAIAGIEDDTDKAYFNEFGTGIVGSQNPHIAEELAKEGYTYDVNSHGEAGWWYPTNENDPNPTKRKTEKGWIAWTKGLPALKGYYEALQNAEELFPKIGEEELSKEAGK